MSLINSKHTKNKTSRRHAPCLQSVVVTPCRLLFRVSIGQNYVCTLNCIHEQIYFTSTHVFKISYWSSGEPIDFCCCMWEEAKWKADMDKHTSSFVIIIIWWRWTIIEQLEHLTQGGVDADVNRSWLREERDHIFIPLPRWWGQNSQWEIMCKNKMVETEHKQQGTCCQIKRCWLNVVVSVSSLWREEVRLDQGGNGWEGGDEKKRRGEGW